MFTLAIIKPDAVGAGKTGQILAHLEQAGFKIRAARLVRLSTVQAEAFYEVHRARSFYRPLVRFMTSGPGLALALERDNAVAHLRVVIGASDPAEAQPGTVRQRYAESKERNAIHAADSPENAPHELPDEPADYPLARDATAIGPRPAVREELLLAVPQWGMLCQDDCRGLCPRCGRDLNAGPCGCAPAVDHRWQELAAFKGKLRE